MDQKGGIIPVQNLTIVDSVDGILKETQKRHIFGNMLFELLGRRLNRGRNNLGRGFEWRLSWLRGGRWGHEHRVRSNLANRRWRYRFSVDGHSGVPSFGNKEGYGDGGEQNVGSFSRNNSNLQSGEIKESEVKVGSFAFPFFLLCGSERGRRKEIKTAKWSEQKNRARKPNWLQIFVPVLPKKKNYLLISMF